METWHEHTPGPLREDLLRVARRLSLGSGSCEAVRVLRSAIGHDARALEAILTVLIHVGGDGAAMVEGLARSVDARADAFDAARAAGSGARVSARLIAVLPLAFLPLAPMTRAPLMDPTGLLLVVLGGGLSLFGMAWIGRLLPRPPDGDDPAAALADLVAAVLGGGVDLRTCFDTLAPAVPRGDGIDLLGIRCLVTLGLPWPAALQRSDHAAMRDLGVILDRAQSLGLPVQASLRAWAASRRADIERDFEARTRRAGVLMMIPLATCVLPSFILLAVAPFLRGLSLG